MTIGPLVLCSVKEAGLSPFGKELLTRLTIGSLCFMNFVFFNLFLSERVPGHCFPFTLQFVLA